MTFFGCTLEDVRGLLPSVGIDHDSTVDTAEVERLIESIDPTVLLAAGPIGTLDVATVDVITSAGRHVVALGVAARVALAYFQLDDPEHFGSSAGASLLAQYEAALARFTTDTRYFVLAGASVTPSPTLTGGGICAPEVTIEDGIVW